MLPNRGDTPVFELEHVGNGGENVGFMMGDKNYLHVLPRKLVEQRKELVARRGIEARERFVKQQGIRLPGKSTGKEQAAEFPG